MNVRDLVAELQNFKPDDEVRIEIQDEHGDAELAIRDVGRFRNTVYVTPERPLIEKSNANAFTDK